MDNLINSILRKYNKSYNNLTIKDLKEDGYLAEYLDDKNNFIWNLFNNTKEIIKDLEINIKIKGLKR